MATRIMSTRENRNCACAHHVSGSSEANSSNSELCRSNYLWRVGLVVFHHGSRLDDSSDYLAASRGIRSLLYSTASALDLSGHSVPKTPRITTHLPVTRQCASIQPRLGDLQRRLFPRWWLCGPTIWTGELCSGLSSPCIHVGQVRYWLMGPEDGEKVNCGN